MQSTAGKKKYRTQRWNIYAVEGKEDEYELLCRRRKQLQQKQTQRRKQTQERLNVLQRRNQRKGPIQK